MTPNRLVLLSVNETTCTASLQEGPPGKPVTVRNAFGFGEEGSSTGYQVFLLRHARLLENSIFQVYDRSLDQRKGWCIPVQALDSTEHSFSDNEHFWKYARAASLKLVSGEYGGDAHLKWPEEWESRIVSIAELFDDNVACLVVSNDTLEDDEKTFPLLEYLPDLHASGFTEATLSNNLISEQSDPPVTPRLKVRRVKAVHAHSFLPALFRDLAPVESNALVVFFYYYQVFELLISAVLWERQDSVFEEIEQRRNDRHFVSEKLDELVSLRKEKRALGFLEERVGAADELSQLREQCNEFLKESDQEDKREWHESLYAVRNLVFHSYREVHGTENLDAIVDRMRSALPVVLEKAYREF